jgi:outer membrane protein insertion porin family
MASVTAEFAGLGGSVKYARLSANAAKYWPLGKGWIFSVSGEGGWIKGLTNNGEVRLTDRFYLGEPQIRGFDIRGVGPRVLRKPYIDTPNGDVTDGVIDVINSYCFKAATATDPQVRNVATSSAACASGETFLGPDGVSTDRNTWQDDAIGGRYYYLGRMELEIPLGSGAREMGIRPSIFLDAGAVWGTKEPQRTDTADLNGDGILDNASAQVFIPSRNSSGLPLYNQIDSTQVNATTGLCEIATTSQVTSAANANTTFTCTPAGIDLTNNTPLGSNTAFREVYLGNSWKPRVAVGIGFNWNSPFGPFRIDFAKTLLKQPGDDTKSFTFNVGTQF